MAAGAALLVAAGLAGITVLQPAPNAELLQSERVAERYLGALNAGRSAEAWDLLAPSAQSTSKRDQFVAAAQRRDLPTGITVDRVSRRASTVSVDYFRIGGEKRTFHSMRLERSGNRWLITGVREPVAIGPPGP